MSGLKAVEPCLVNGESRFLLYNCRTLNFGQRYRGVFQMSTGKQLFPELAFEPEARSVVTILIDSGIFWSMHW